MSNAEAQNMGYTYSRNQALMPEPSTMRRET
jgi:hypothetical protein